MSKTRDALVHTFWHRDPTELQKFYPHRHSYVWRRSVGPYVVRTWTNRDGKPIATGWFTV